MQKKCLRKWAHQTMGPANETNKSEYHKSDIVADVGFEPTTSSQ